MNISVVLMIILANGTYLLYGMDDMPESKKAAVLPIGNASYFIIEGSENYFVLEDPLPYDTSSVSATYYTAEGDAIKKIRLEDPTYDRFKEFLDPKAPAPKAKYISFERYLFQNLSGNFLLFRDKHENHITFLSCDQESKDAKDVTGVIENGEWTYLKDLTTVDVSDAQWTEPTICRRRVTKRIDAVSQAQKTEPKISHLLPLADDMVVRPEDCCIVQ